MQSVSRSSSLLYATLMSTSGKPRPYVSSALFFMHNESLKPPYRVIVDTNFINFSIQNKFIANRRQQNKEDAWIMKFRVSNAVPMNFPGVNLGDCGNVMDERWRKQLILELEVYSKRLELVQDQIKLSLEDLRSRGS